MKLCEKLRQVLEGTEDSYIFPFFWQHGEDEATLREYMKAIREANIRQVCVESRPHPDFAGPDWWRDMDVILDEAVKSGMRVWILDDQHFPTGYAAGAVEQADPSLCHQYLDYNTLVSWGPKPRMEVDVAAYAKPQPVPPWMPPMPPAKRVFHEDRLFRVLACRIREGGLEECPVDLTEQVQDGKLLWDVPEGCWKLYIVYLTRDARGRNDYINFLDRNSCRLLIDAVYEPHYARYGRLFGNTIAGFFSDEPPIGNTPGYTPGDLIGKPDMPLSWSGEMENALDREYGSGEWRSHLNCLWSKAGDDHETARMRTAYMNAVSKLVAECFSAQLGTWCEEHGVEYIGHMLEDCDSNANLGPSMGHFFRGLSGQHMAGIDNIGGQVVPGGQDMPRRLPSMCQDDAGFYHYMLGRMGASMGVIDPKKKGRCMCENFGAYGWRLGVRTEKYLMDHFLARGVNRFVPHAFSPKAFPDPDCPPHFYAHGENPQYRAFGQLMAYTNRICHLLDGGTDCSKVALLYHGESQWAGAFESNILVCRVLTESQTGFLLIPADTLGDAETTAFDEETRTLRINGTALRALVVSGCRYLTKPAAVFIARAKQAGFPVFFTGRLPEGVSDVEEKESVSLLEGMKDCEVVPVTGLPAVFGGFPYRTALTEWPERYLTAYHYDCQGDVFVLLNENPSKTFAQWVTLPAAGRLTAYDAWRNRLTPVETERDGEAWKVYVRLAPLEMAVLVSAEAAGMMAAGPSDDAPGAHVSSQRKCVTLSAFRVSRCEGKEYPAFYGEEDADLENGMALRHPEFSGYYRYETTVEAQGWKKVRLEIEDVYESAEVFVNGVSAGMVTAQPYFYELGDLDGTVSLAIEAATTLERKAAFIGADVQGMGAGAPLSPTGIVGAVTLSFC